MDFDFEPGAVFVTKDGELHTSSSRINLTL